MTAAAPLRIGQFSAFFGDRDDGARQLIDADVDVLVGDYLAELTMMILRKNQLRGRPAYAATFLAQIDGVLDQVAARGIRIVTNAGGLDPVGCADALRARLRERGLGLRVAAVVGDDITAEVPRLLEGGIGFENLDSGASPDFEATPVMTANAYLGAWPIVEALAGGADVVICPRVTDASLIVGPAAWHFGWQVDDWDRLAGALVAGHVIECGAQATGGQFSLFDRWDDLGLPGMPIATVHHDGSSSISKPSGTGGVVSVDTVSAQLLYEIGSSLYENPDVLTDFGTVQLERQAPDVVRIHSAKGSPPSADCKVSMAFEGGFRNTAVVGITGGRTEAKVAWLRREVERAVGVPENFDDFRWTVVGPRREEGGTYDDTTALVVISARDRDRAKVSQAGFSGPITKLAVSNIPGYYLLTPPGAEQSVGRHWPTTVPKAELRVRVVDEDGTETPVPWTAPVREALPSPAVRPPVIEEAYDDARVVTLIRDLAGTRSGDKGGTANLGVWTAPGLYPWLARTLTVAKVKELVPELGEFEVVRYELPNLSALNFVARSFLGDGVASCLRLDGQAKGLGEQLGAQSVEVPAGLLRRALTTWPTGKAPR